MPSFRAREPIYLCTAGRLIDTGEVFSSDETPGLAWIPLETPPPLATAPRKSAPIGK
ncbi:hypothetical protein [Novosphingobium sp. FSW06-99]|uniref:hypothetical protein n=1 Tax=Novosphingobium sp. FSW06-99 TaxID=1739113 RepID=UPI000A4C598D|nr:hypothetical protein [Novosphingobium sp. FSW06-99]